MSKRLYNLIVIAQISLIALLVLFVLNGERVLEKVRAMAPASNGFSFQDSGYVVTRENENRYL